jgi:hypothetical protein
MNLTDFNNLLKIKPDRLGLLFKAQAEQLARIAVAVYVAGYELGLFIHNLNDRITYGKSRLQETRTSKERVHQRPSDSDTASETKGDVGSNRRKRQHHPQTVVTSTPISAVAAKKKRTTKKTTTQTTGIN